MTGDIRIVDSLRDLAVPIDDVHPYPGNARKSTGNRIRKSLRRHGQYRPITANVRTKDVLAGNHVWMEMKDLGATEVAVGWVDVDDDEAREIVARDNRSGEEGDEDGERYDPQLLHELLEPMDVKLLDDIGYSSKDLDELLAEVAPEILDDDDDGFSAYDGMAAEGSSAGGGASLSGDKGEWVVLRFADLRVKVKRAAYQELNDRLLRENKGNRGKAGLALAMLVGFAASQCEEQRGA